MLVSTQWREIFGSVLYARGSYRFHCDCFTFDIGFASNEFAFVYSGWKAKPGGVPDFSWARFVRYLDIEFSPLHIIFPNVRYLRTVVAASGNYVNLTDITRCRFISQLAAMGSGRQVTLLAQSGDGWNILAQEYSPLTAQCETCTVVVSSCSEEDAKTSSHLTPILDHPGLHTVRLIFGAHDDLPDDQVPLLRASDLATLLNHLAEAAKASNQNILVYLLRDTELHVTSDPPFEYDKSYSPRLRRPVSLAEMSLDERRMSFLDEVEAKLGSKAAGKVQFRTWGDFVSEGGYEDVGRINIETRMFAYDTHKDMVERRKARSYMWW